MWSSTRIVALDDGALVIDEDSGMLVRTDVEGRPVSEVAIGRSAGQLAFDERRKRAYVADRMGDRLVVVDVGAALQIVQAWPTAAEPYGVGLSPDGSLVVVGMIADRVLVGYDAANGHERYRIPLSPEPRSVVVSPDGKRALIASARMGVLDDVALDQSRPSSTIAFDLACDDCAVGTAYARGGGAITFLDAQRAVVSFQRAVPEALGQRAVSRYGGGRLTPVTQHLAFLSFGETTGQVVGQIVANDPRAIAWDAARDALYVAGRASGTILRLASLSHSTLDEIGHSAQSFEVTGSEICGPDGIALSTKGTVYLWCSLSRRVVHVRETGMAEGPAVAASALAPDEHLGMVLFHATSRAINTDHALACSTCHIDGRTDGLSWKIGHNTLQTPLLTGRLADTAPYKWDAHDATLGRSIASTIGRLGGIGLSVAETDALVTYLERLPAPRKPTLDAAAVERGKRVFEGAAGCTECHGGPRFTDRELHRFKRSTLDRADTPSLIGLAASAPYYHDGSAATLDALVRGDGHVKMTDFTTLAAADRADLVEYLRSL